MARMRMENAGRLMLPSLDYVEDLVFRYPAGSLYPGVGVYPSIALVSETRIFPTNNLYLMG